VSHLLLQANLSPTYVETDVPSVPNAVLQQPDGRISTHPATISVGDEVGDSVPCMTIGGGSAAVGDVVEGALEGANVGDRVGVADVGADVGHFVGAFVGVLVGLKDVGCDVGARVGDAVVGAVGAVVGDCVGHLKQRAAGEHVAVWSKSPSLRYNRH
jgi:hypothetical protein